MAEKPTRPAHEPVASAGIASALGSWFRFPRATRLALALGLLVTLPSVGIGLLLDDHVHADFILKHLQYGGERWWDLFGICCREGTGTVSQRIAVGLLPWWTHPKLSMALFRPLSVASQYLDYALWPNAPWLMHVHNMAWYALILLLVGALYRRVIGGWVGVLALCMYAIDEAHVEGTAWIASRNTLMSATFALCAIVAHDRLRRDSWKPGAWLAPLALLLGLASGEGAITAWAYLLPYALWLDRASVRQRLLSLVPMLVVTVGWQLLYRQLGYGVHGSGVYRDPFDSPWFFFVHRVPEVLPIVLREQLLPSTTAVQGWPVLISPAMLWALFVLCLASVAVWLVLLVKRRELAFWTFALLASALPLCAIGMSPRLLFLSSVASFAVVAELIGALWAFALRALGPGGGLARAGALLLSLGWFAIHVPLSLVWAPHAYQTILDYEGMFDISAQRLPDFDRARVDTLLVLNTPNYFVTSLSPGYAKLRPWPAHVFILGATAAPFRVARLDVNTVRLKPQGGYMLEPLSQLVRAPEVPFVRGQLIQVGPLTASVDELTADGRPAAVSFRALGVASPSLLWVAWYGDRYHRIELPAVGTSLEIPGF